MARAWTVVQGLLTVALQPTTSDHSVNFTSQKRYETSNVITLIVTVASVASNYQMTVNIYDSVRYHTGFCRYRFIAELCTER